MNDKIWTSFQEQQPNEAGPYWWRLKSAKLEGATLIFVAHMRMRGTCGEPILSPRFDHWTGWRVQVPECEWSLYDGEPTDKIEYEHLSVEGLSLTPCPFCGKTPKLKAWQACSGGGFIIGPYPQNYNLWKLECCAWGSSPDGKDPRQLEQIRRDAFLRIAASHVKPLEDALAALRGQYNDAIKIIEEENAVIARYNRFKSCLDDDPDFVKLCDVLDKTAQDLRSTHDVCSWGIGMTVEHIKETAIELAAAKERERVLVEALKACMERIPAFESKKNQDVLKQSRSALASVKENTCKGNIV